MTMAIAITILSILVLGALLKGVAGYLWARSGEGETWSRGHALGWW